MTNYVDYNLNQCPSYIVWFAYQLPTLRVCAFLEITKNKRIIPFFITMVSSSRIGKLEQKKYTYRLSTKVLLKTMNLKFEKLTGVATSFLMIVLP